MSYFNQLGQKKYSVNEEPRGRSNLTCQESYLRQQSRGTARNLNENHSNQRIRSSKRMNQEISQHSNTSRADKFSMQHSNFKKSQQQHQSSRNQSRTKQFVRKSRGDIRNQRYFCKYVIGHCKYGWNCQDNHYYMLHMGKWENNPDSNELNPQKERPWVNKGIEKQQKNPASKVLVRIVETKLVSIKEAFHLFKGQGKNSTYRQEIQVAATNMKAIIKFQNQIEQASQLPENDSKTAMDELTAKIWLSNCMALSAKNDELDDSSPENHANFIIETHNNNANKALPSCQRTNQVGQMKNQQNMRYIPQSEADAQRGGIPFQRDELDKQHPQNNQLSQNYHNKDNMNFFLNQEQQLKIHQQEQPQQMQEKTSVLVRSKPPHINRVSLQEKIQQPKPSDELAQESGFATKKYSKRPKQSGDDIPVLRGNRLPPSLRKTESPFREDDWLKK